MENPLRKRLLREMLYIRTVEERIAELYTEQEMRCPVHLCTGQEASEAGTCVALEKSDYVVSGHRSHGHFLAKGGNLQAMMAEIYGKKTGCSGGKGGSMHLVDLKAGFLGSAPIVGSTIPIGVGAAFSSHRRGEGRVTMIFFGDGATETGVFHESLNFAKLHNLPVVFVCENNLYSVYSPLDVRQPKDRPIVEMVRGFGIVAHQEDGNDVEKVYQLSQYAIEKARTGSGPVFLELMTYRWREHCGPHFDNDIGYRTEEEYQVWREKDPVERYKNMLLKDEVLGLDEFNAIKHGVVVEIDEAVAFAKKSPFPETHLAETNVFAE